MADAHGSFGQLWGEKGRKVPRRFNLWKRIKFFSMLRCEIWGKISREVLIDQMGHNEVWGSRTVGVTRMTKKEPCIFSPRVGTNSPAVLSHHFNRPSSRVIIENISTREENGRMGHYNKNGGWLLLFAKQIRVYYSSLPPHDTHKENQASCGGFGGRRSVMSVWLWCGGWFYPSENVCGGGGVGGNVCYHVFSSLEEMTPMRGRG